MTEPGDPLLELGLRRELAEYLDAPAPAAPRWAAARGRRRGWRLVSGALLAGAAASLVGLTAAAEVAHTGPFAGALAGAASATPPPSTTLAVSAAPGGGHRAAGSAASSPAGPPATTPAASAGAGHGNGNNGGSAHGGNAGGNNNGGGNGNGGGGGNNAGAAQRQTVGGTQGPGTGRTPPG